jgi:hypothetical protein
MTVFTGMDNSNAKKVKWSALANLQYQILLRLSEKTFTVKQYHLDINVATPEKLFVETQNSVSKYSKFILQ